jgi:hypothetical protein
MAQSKIGYTYAHVFRPLNAPNTHIKLSNYGDENLAIDAPLGDWDYAEIREGDWTWADDGSHVIDSTTGRKIFVQSLTSFPLFV